MKDSIRQRLQKLAERFEEVGRLLATDEVAGGSSQFRELSVEYARLQPLAESFDRYRDLERDLAAAHDLEDDPDAGMRTLGEEELGRVKRELEVTEQELRRLLLPKDPRDDKHILLEVRAGTEGDEAARGAGGQHVNKTDSAVRITHLPSGIVVECQDERSQHKNRSRAMALLRARLLAAEQEKQQSAVAASRRLQVGSGDRSERIRTYNFPQGRVTDHRINLTLYKLPQILDGQLDELIEPLQQEHQAELLAEEV